MGQVYECGLFTITSNIPHENQGWKVPPPPRYKPGPMLRTHYDDFINWISTILREGPLSRRAWCLQEQYLSPRLLHIFAGPTWIWECNSHMNAGDSWGLIDTPVSSKEYEAWASHGGVSDLCGHRTMLRMDPGIDRATALRFWDTILHDYSNRALTYESDRLPALSGIASKVQQLLNSKYMAGIWECDLQGLLWVRSEGKWMSMRRKGDNAPYFWTGYGDSDNDTSSILESQSSDQDSDEDVVSYTKPVETQSSENSEPAQEPYLGPSWSWVSVVGPVRMQIRGPSLQDFAERSKATYRFSPTLLNSTMVVDGDNLFGKVKEGSQITISAHLLILGTFEEDIDVCFDRKLHCPPGLEDYKLLVVDLVKKESSDCLWVWGLILWNVNPSSQKLLSRVGVFRVAFQVNLWSSADDDSEPYGGYRGRLGRKLINRVRKEDFDEMEDSLWDKGAISDKMEFTLV
jgi:hypothetical protein